MPLKAEGLAESAAMQMGNYSRFPGFLSSFSVCMRGACVLAGLDAPDISVTASATGDHRQGW